MSVDGRLRASLLGGVHFSVAEVPVLPSSRKGLAMLVLLALRPDGWRREDLAEMLWGVGKLASVRQALYELRRLPHADLWLRDEGVGVRVEADVDVVSFEQACASGRMEEALAVYKGPLLDGWSGVPIPAFSDWWAIERERLVMLQLLAMRSEAERLESVGRFAEARQRVLEVLNADPLSEAPYRAAMRLAYVLGDVEGATEMYRRCSRTLRREFASEPSPETKALAAAIERGEPLAVSADVGRLPLSQLRLLQAVAVGAGRLSVEAIARVVERPAFDIAAELSELVARELVDAHVCVTPRYLAQVLASTPMVLRRLLHERTAEALVSEQADVAGVVVDEAVVGEHLLAAGNAAAAAPRFLRAAKGAADRGDLSGAVSACFRVLWAAEGESEDRLSAAILLEGLATQTGDESLQEAALAEAERLAWRLQSDRHLAEVRMRRSRTKLRRGEPDAAIELAGEALDIGLRLQDGVLVARARNAVGGARFYAGDLDGAVEAFSLNDSVADPVERFRACNNLGTLAAMRGDLVEAYRRFDQALTLARSSATQAEVAATLNNLAATAERMADYRRSVRHFREGLDLARRHRASGVEGQMLLNLAVVYARQGQLGPAWNTAIEVEELARDQDDRRLLVHSAEQRADVCRICGHDALALELIDEAVEGASMLGDERKRLALHSQRATLRFLAGRAELAEAEAAIESLASVRLADIAPWLWLEIALSVDDPDLAREALSRLPSPLENRHMRLLGDLVRLRLALLPGARDADHMAAAKVADRLVLLEPEAFSTAAGSERRRSGLASFEVVERPLAWWLLRLWSERHPGFLLPSHLPDVAEALAEQAEGLPKALRASLRHRPQHWGAGLQAR